MSSLHRSRCGEANNEIDFVSENELHHHVNYYSWIAFAVIRHRLPHSLHVVKMTS